MSAPQNFTCGVLPVTAVGPPCSGHGSCNYDLVARRGVCLCQPGWQGESDFQVTNSLLDCQINVVAIKVLWGIFIAFHIYSYIRYLPKLRWLWRKHKTVVERHKTAGRKYTLWNNKGLVAFVPYVTLGWWSQLAYAIIKLVNQDLKIGHSVLITVLYLIWRTTFFFAPNTFQPALVESLLKSQRNLDHLITRNKRLSQFSLVIAILLGIPSIIPMVVAQDPLKPTVGIASMVVLLAGGSLSMLFLVIQAAYIDRRVQAILGKSYEISPESRTKIIMDKMRANQRQVMVNGGIQFAVYGFFTAFPYLWNKHDYLLPFSFILVNVTISRAVASLVQDEETPTSTAAPSSTISNENNQLSPVEPSGTKHVPRPPPQQRLSTVIQTMDASTVVEVQSEDDPTLLATGKQWATAKSGARSSEGS